MSYAIDELAPFMWIFFLILGFVILIGICMLIYRWVASDPCQAYNMIAFYWGRVGDHCAQ
jgi:hypothetical protein